MANTVTCGKCLTQNPPDQDFCTECGEPLTASAEQGLREHDDAQNTGTLIAGPGTDGRPAVVPGIAGAGMVGGAGGILPPIGDPNRPGAGRDW